MATKRKAPRAPRIRDIPGTKARTPKADDRVMADIDGPTYIDPICGRLFDTSQLKHGLRQLDTGEFEERPTLQDCEVLDEADQRNGVVPTDSNGTRGKLLSPTRKVKDGAIKLGEYTLPSPLELVNRLVRTQSTAEVLESLKSTDCGLDRAGLRALLSQVVDSPTWTCFTDITKLAAPELALRETRIEKLLDAVSRNLERYYGVPRDWEYKTG